jgi:hypothetical protein
MEKHYADCPHDCSCWDAAKITEDEEDTLVFAFRVRCIRSSGITTPLVKEGVEYTARSLANGWIDILGPCGYVAFIASDFERVEDAMFIETDYSLEDTIIDLDNDLEVLFTADTLPDPGFSKSR